MRGISSKTQFLPAIVLATALSVTLAHAEGNGQILTFESGPTVSANPAIINTALQFTAVCNGAAPVTWSWSFGDGATDTSGGVVSHTYTVSAVYVVTASATDGNGKVYGGTIFLQVANVDGTMGEVSALSTVSFFVTKFSAGLKFDNGGKDKAAISGLLADVPKTFDPASVTVNVGGVETTFALDKKGMGKSGGNSIGLKLMKKKNKGTKVSEFVGGNVPFKISLKDGSYTPLWADEGVDPLADKTNVNLVMGVELAFDGIIYSAKVDTIYSSKAQKTGKLKN